MSRRLLLAGLLVGALLRVGALPLRGTSDVFLWKVWSYAAVRDLTGIYGVGGSPPERRALAWPHFRGMVTVDYPPVTLYEMALVGRSYHWLHPRFDDSRALNVFVKLPGLIAEILLVVTLLTWGRRRFGDEAAAWAALAFWLNPAVILDGAVLGYLDAQMAVPAVLALAAAASGAGWLAGALEAIAVLTKAQAIFALPVCAVVLYARSSGRRWQSVGSAALGGGVASGLLLAPYVLRGAWANLAQAVGRLATQDMLSAQAANAWWIFTWVLRARDVAGSWGWWRALTMRVQILAITRAMELGYPNARVAGTALVVAAIAWAAWRARRVSSLAWGAALAGWCVYAYALFSAQAHENHLYLAVPFLALAAGLDRRYRRVFWAVSAVVTLNLYLFYGFGYDWPPVIDRGWTLVDMTVLLSFVSLGVFVWFTMSLPRMPSRPDAQEPLLPLEF